MRDVAEDEYQEETPLEATPTTLDDRSAHDIAAANVKLVEAEAIDDEIDLNAKREYAPEEAKRMVNWQRKKFSVTIENAELDEREILRRFPDGILCYLFRSYL